MDLYFSPYATSSNQTGNKVSSNCLHRTPEYLKGVWGFTLTDHDISIVYIITRSTLWNEPTPPAKKNLWTHCPPPPNFAKLYISITKDLFFVKIFYINLAAPTFNLLPTALIWCFAYEKKNHFQNTQDEKYNVCNFTSIYESNTMTRVDKRFFSGRLRAVVIN